MIAMTSDPVLRVRVRVVDNFSHSDQLLVIFCIFIFHNTENILNRDRFAEVL